MASSSSAGSSSAAISKREQIFVRYAVVHAKRMNQKFAKKVILKAVVAANNNDVSCATDKKYYEGRPTARNCFYAPSNPYFFIPYRFDVRIIKNTFSETVLTNLCAHLDFKEEYVKSTIMSSTLPGSDSPLWFLDQQHPAVSEACQVVTNPYEEIVDNEEVLTMFKEFVARGKILSVTAFLTYDEGYECGPPNLQHVDGVFFSAILIIKDSTRGRLKIEGVSLSEEFDKGDLIRMNPRVFHSVPEYKREEQRKVVVFTC